MNSSDPLSGNYQLTHYKNIIAGASQTVFINPLVTGYWFGVIGNSSQGWNAGGMSISGNYLHGLIAVDFFGKVIISHFGSY